MNKKGFTLIEVIVSIILVSVVLTSMLASLVKLRNAYEDATKNTDALVFSSSLARIINNDFAQNGGIRYMDCTYYGDYCDITLNNDQKRKIEIYPVQTSKTWGYYLSQYENKLSNLGLNPTDDEYKKKKTEYLKNIVIRYTEDSTNAQYISLADYFKTTGAPANATAIKNLLLGTGSTPTTRGISSQVYCEEMQSGNDVYLSGLCEVNKSGSDYSASCECSQQEISTSLRYSDVTNGVRENIYVKTLSLLKEKDLYFETAAGTYVQGSNKIRTTGYNFGKLTFHNIFYDNTSRSSDYIDSLSLISIEINDGISVMDSSYNINLSSTSSYDKNSTQVGNMICFDFDNFTGSPNIEKVNQLIDEFCIRYGVGFSIRKGSYYTKIDKFNVSSCDLNNHSNNKINSDAVLTELTNVCHAPVDAKTEPSSYVFDGYYYDPNDDHDDGNEIDVIDALGNIKITSTYFDSSVADTSPRLYAKWKSR